MAIEFQCPSCAATVRVPDHAAGKKGSCPSCKVKLIVPQLEEDSVEEPAPTPRKRVAPTPAPVEEKRPAKPKKQAAPEINLGLEPVINLQPADGGKKKEEANFGDILKLDLGGDSAPAKPTKAAKKNRVDVVNEAPLSAAEIQESHEVAEVVDAEIPEFMQELAAPDEGLVADAYLPSQSVAAKAQRKLQKQGGSKAGLIFGIICGVGLIGGVIWLALSKDTKLAGERIAYSIERGASLQPITIGNDEIGLDEEVIETVLKAIKKNPVKITMDSMHMEFTSSRAGFEISLKESDTTQFFRFPLDKEMKAFRDKNLKSLDAERTKQFTGSLKKFFEKSDVAIRNREGALPLANSDPREIGLNACVRALGYNVAALVPNGRGVTPYPVVYEDEANLYFLLPNGTKQFQVVGRKPDGTASEFPGKYTVKVRAKKSDSGSDKESDDADSSGSSDKMEAEPAEMSEKDDSKSDAEKPSMNRE